ncbi:MAG TPA: aminoacyl-tRNA hydrolase [Pyrinomonadaceae bacterium]|nr:aminoacyl-tRNA hydrolase [Pyrinomonadaceae bacterium]
MAIGNWQLAMFLIVGLGNPGLDYEWTRHNLGFMLIDKLATEFSISVSRRECRSFVGRGEIEGVIGKLAKPQTYMNLSGEAVGCLVAKQDLTPPYENLVVVVDDLALPFGTIRIRARGTAGGHNGLKSIISVLGTNEFTRLRIGIQPDHPVADAKRFVLDSFSRAARPEVEKILETSTGAIRTILRDGVLKAMTEYNS